MTKGLAARYARCVRSTRGARLTRLFTLTPFVILLVLLAGWLIGVPRPLFDVGYSRVLFDREGRLLGARTAPDEQWRFPLSERELPERYVAALLAFEDERFLRHPGIDPIAIARAVGSNLRAGRIVSGGSTITMQLARLVYGPGPRTYARKLAEASLALRLELGRSKDEILRLFAAHAPFGGNVVGIEAASWRYFARPLGAVTWAEGALLAVLPNSPSMMHLSHERDALRQKRDRLLERLAARGYLDAAELALARSEPIPREPRPIPQVAVHLLQTLASEHPDQWRTETTIDSFLQHRAAEVVAGHGRRLRPVGVEHAAALILDVATGEVLAYVGNLPPRDPPAFGDFVDIVRAPRSTGSLLKPLLYAGMLDAGELLPHQIVADIPTRIGGYIPENHTHDFLGAVRVDEALASSLNVPAARLLRDYGVARFHALLADSGITTLVRSPSEYGIPLILGGAESTLWELTGVYASMARTVRARSREEPTFFAPRLDPDREPSDAMRSPFSPAALYLTLTALNEVERPRELAGWQNFASAGEISWKTGTSYGLRDAWAIGVNERYAVGVWVGNASGRGAPGLRGTASAGPIMFQLFELLEPGRGFLSPGGLRQVRVCAQSGLLAGPDCADVTTALVPRAAHDHRVCPYCTTLHLDASGRVQVNAEIHPVATMRHEQWFVLPPAMAWYYEQRSTDYVPPPPFDPRILSPSSPITIAFPLPDAELYIPVEMDGSRGSMVARAHHPVRDEELYWHLDGDYLGSTRGEHEVELSPPAGVHRLAVVDSAGNFVETRFEVLERR